MSSKAGGALDLIKNNGFIFDKDDVDGVKNYIEQLRQYPAKYQLASQASLQHSKCFDFLQIVKAVEKACN
jgi:glycosyltransferase involved in cell wall biosynthesis